MIHHHELWWRFFPKKELTQVYVSSAIRTFAISFLGIFIPLYLYIEQGFSLSETLVFFIFYSIIFAIMSPAAAKFSARYGVKHSILLSIPFYLIFIGLLYALPNFNTPLIIISSMLGFSQAFYWMGMHMVFYNASDKKHRGEEVGKRTCASVLAGTIGPLIGGFLIMTIGFKPVFGIASLFLLTSALVLFKSKDKHTRYEFSVRSVIDKKHWKNSLFFVSRGTGVIAEGVVWPLFIFVILGNYFSLGIVGSLLSGVSAVLLLTVGKYSDHTNKRKIVRWMTSFNSFVWFLRAFVVTAAQVYGVTILAALATGIRESPLGALEYDNAKEGAAAAYFVHREIFICLGRVLMLTLVIMTNSLSGGLFFQGIANFATFLF